MSLWRGGDRCCCSGCCCWVDGVDRLVGAAEGTDGTQGDASQVTAPAALAARADPRADGEGSRPRVCLPVRGLVSLGGIGMGGGGVEVPASAVCSSAPRGVSRCSAGMLLLLLRRRLQVGVGRFVVQPGRAVACGQVH